LDDLTNVSQGGQPRAYSYNSLSQLTSASNPEASGATTYTYDANGNVATRTRPAANQTNPNVTTTTSYSYDVLNRLLSKTYPDGTPAVTLFYDVAPASWPQWAGISFAYADGRMTAACTGSAVGTCASPQTAEVFSYDQMGRVANLWQCAPYNCGSSGIWSMPYTYDLAGDVTNYVNPAGFNVTQGINGAQQPTSLSYGANGAVSSITYTPWGAIDTMCGGQGCAQSQETRQYNNRLQPVLMELGNSSNPSADYSLTYTYTGSPSPPCSTSQGAGDNGNITGSTYTDNVNSGYSHTFTYCYDGVNRLTDAVASGSPAYNLMYSYDQYGNPSCVGGSGGGVCPALSYDLSTNHVTLIGGVPITYDAAGNQSNDQFFAYQYDAEGRVKYSTSTGQWQYPMYNALGQRVEDYQGPDTLTLTYPRDIFGQRTGAFAQWPSQNWTGWNVYWSQIAGQRLNMGGASAYIDHSDAVGSTTMETDPAGGVQWDVTHYPWGRVFQEQGIRQSEVVMGLDWQVNDPALPSATREFNFRDYRWMTPDPDNAGSDLGDSQSWNMYSYAGNNPITNGDPSGMYCVQNDQGVWHDDGNGGETCADVFKSDQEQQKHPSVTVTGKPGSDAAAVAVNALLSLSNLANSYFAPIVGRPSYMQDVPNGSGVAAKIGQGVGVVASMAIAPEGDAEKGISILEGRLTKVLEAHTAGGILATGAKSLFDNPEEVRGLIEAAGSASPVRQAGGNFERVVDAGRIIGTDATTGLRTSVYTVITDTSGNLVTAFPGLPTRP
jgi:RHS repeat-associated protein